MYKFLANRTVSILNQYTYFSSADYEVIHYGATILYLNITKFFLVYVLAYYLNILPYTFTVNIGFSILRTAAYGVHANKSVDCTLFMIISFIGLSYLSIYINYSYLIFAFILPIICIVLLLLYAPADTKKKPLLQHDFRQKKKKQAICLFLILYIFSLFLSHTVYAKAIILGLFLECLCTTPIVYKLFKGGYKNYEKHIV